MSIEELRRRIEVAMNAKYARRPDTPAVRAEIAADLALLHEVFPELDITAEVSDDRRRASLREILDSLQALRRR